MTGINIKVEDKAYRKLKSICAEDNIKIKDKINELIKKYVEEYKEDKK